MHNFKLIISYDGTNYQGWQIQKNGITVQETIEKAIYRLFNENIKIIGSSRTDSGVHAKFQVANFKIKTQLTCQKIKLALNKYLPVDIVILKVEEVSLDFHSRFDAKEKNYKYYILNSRDKDPFKDKYSWQVPYELDILKMGKEANCLIGEHDFKSFKAKDKKEKQSIRKIYDITIKKKFSFIEIQIKGNGFLYNMVRNIVGTLVDIGRGYLSIGSMKNILKNKDRTFAGPTAPAKGLFLEKILY